MWNKNVFSTSLNQKILIRSSTARTLPGSRHSWFASSYERALNMLFLGLTLPSNQKPFIGQLNTKFHYLSTTKTCAWKSLLTSSWKAHNPYKLSHNVIVTGFCLIKDFSFSFSYQLVIGFCLIKDFSFSATQFQLPLRIISSRYRIWRHNMFPV